MTLRRVADRLRAVVEQYAQHPPGIVGRAANQKIVGHRSPCLFQPGEVRLEPACGRDDAPGADLMLDAVAHHDRRAEPSVLYVEVDHRGVVIDFDAERLRGTVIGVDQCLPAAEKERVRARKVQRAAQR